MKVKLLEDNSLYQLKEGDVINLPDEIARELISKGGAMKAIDTEAYEALLAGKYRDESARNAD